MRAAVEGVNTFGKRYLMTHKSTQNSVDSLLKVMRSLRAPDGCPWDAEQTPESLAPFIMEEACELIEAIEKGLPELIMDELGDLLLQVVFQAQIFNERNQFDFHDVATAIAEKLVRRHPHVFDQESSKDRSTDLDKQWEEIKKTEANNNRTCLADHLPENLPSLQKAQKLITKAHRANRDEELYAATEQEFSITGLSGNNDKAVQLDEEILGEALFHLVALAHDANLDAETALRKMTRKVLKKLDHNT